MYKATIVLALAAFVSAGNVAYLDHHVGSAAEQTVRGFGGVSSVSHQARNVNSAFSTSSAYKTKVTNNAVYAPAAYAAPAYAHAVAAPAYAAPAYATHAVAAPAYAAPAYAHAVHAPAYAAPIARALPVASVAKVAAPGLLGVAYSPVVPGVATLNFDGFGVHYGY